MKVLIDSRGYVVREDPAGIEMPEGVTGADSLRYKRVNNAWVDAFPDDVGDDFMESRDVLAAVRAASNAHEDALDAITTQEALDAFHPANF